MHILLVYIYASKLQYELCLQAVVSRWSQNIFIWNGEEALFIWTWEACLPERGGLPARTWETCPFERAGLPTRRWKACLLEREKLTCSNVKTCLLYSNGRGVPARTWRHGYSDVKTCWSNVKTCRLECERPSLFKRDDMCIETCLLERGGWTWVTRLRTVQCVVSGTC